MRPDPTTKSDVQSRYGWREPRGESRNARRKEDEEIPASARRCVRLTVVRFVNAREALVADGSVRRDGRVRVLSVYERPYLFSQISASLHAQDNEDRECGHGDRMEGYRTVSRPSEIDPTNLSVETVLEAMIADGDFSSSCSLE